MRLPLALLAALLLPGLPLTAGVIATDGNVPRTMNDGGTAANPSDYIIGENGPYNHTFTGSAALGNGRSYYNRLFLRNGSTLHASDIFHIGNRGRNNSVLVTGANSLLRVDGLLTIGPVGPNNTLTVAAGGQVDSLGGGQMGANDTVGNDETIHVTGRDSQWHNTGAFLITGEANNRVLITDAALVTFSEAPTFGGGTGNFIGLDGGFLALAGDQRDWLNDLIANERLRHWDAAAGGWLVSGFSDLRFDTFADEADALAFSGYAGLAGYTIITAGLAAVPEPATCAALAGLAALGLAAFRRQRKRAAREFKQEV